jgi:hypothetical protein
VSADSTTLNSLWPPLAAGGPIAALARADQLVDLTDHLRDTASHHHDTAWVHPAPSDPANNLPNMSQDLLDAIGAVGLRQPRAAGERHLLRALTHLVHGPVRHLVIDDADTLTVDTLEALHEAALIAQVQLWLIFDAGQRPARPSPRYLTAFEWLQSTCVVIRPVDLAAMWERRPPAPACKLPDAGWWQRPLDDTHPWDHQTTPHDAQRCSTPAQRVECLIGRGRRAMTAGHTTATHVRQRLLEHADHPDTNVEHRWALAAAGRDLYTPGMDALWQTHPDADSVRLADIGPDGATVHLAGQALSIAPMRRAAVAKLRTSRRLAGCLEREPINGLFDETTGINFQRRRRPPSR